MGTDDSPAPTMRDEIHATRQVYRWSVRRMGATNDVQVDAQRRGYDPGSFIDALLDAWIRADHRNAMKLAGAWPEYGGAMEVAKLLGPSGVGPYLDRLLSGEDTKPGPTLRATL